MATREAELRQDRNLNIRISERLREQIRRAATKAGHSSESEWIRTVLEARAKIELLKR